MSIRKIAVANQKGGTAKTATALSLGVALARKGARVLLVDTDPQGDLTKSLGWRDPDRLEVTLADHIHSSVNDTPLDPRRGLLHHKESIDLMPANIKLADVEATLFSAIDRECILSEWLENLESDYDYVIFDCMPTLGLLPINVFVAATSVIIPVSSEYLPAVGMTALLKSVARIQRRLNPQLKIEGVLITMFDGRTRLAREVERTIRDQFSEDVFRTKIPRAVAAAEASSTGSSVFTYDPEGKVAQAYTALAEEVIAHGEEEK